MKFKTVTVSVIVVLLATAGFAGVGSAASTDAETGPFQAENQTANETATITVSAAGQASADPDVALVYVTATGVGPNSSVASDRLASNASQLREALLAANVSEDQLRTTGYTIFQQPVRPPVPETVQPDQPERNRTEFVALQSFEVRLDDTARAGEIVDVAVANGADRVEGVTFTLSEETRRELRQEALQDAMTSARGQAQTLADSADLQLGGVGSISTSESEFTTFRDVQETFAADAPETGIESGPVTVTATVSVTYNTTG